MPASGERVPWYGGWVGEVGDFDWEISHDRDLLTVAPGGTKGTAHGMKRVGGNTVHDVHPGE